MNTKLLSGVMLSLSILAFSQNSNINKQRKQLQKQYAKLDKSLKILHSQKSNPVPPNQYNEQDFKDTMNPETGAPQFYKLLGLKNDLESGKYRPTQPISMLSNIGGSGKSVINQPWTERGPYEVGGRTRAIVFDPNDPAGKTVFAGGVSGGLWKNSDITNPNSEWVPLSALWANTSVSCIAFDPTNSLTFYVGTGECETGDAIGSGIWKTTDGGNTFTNIFTVPPTYSGGNRHGIFYVNDIKVRNHNGVTEIYAGVSGGNIGINFNDGFSGLREAGLYKSTDGGANFAKLNSMVVPENSALGLSIQQIEIAADNAVWVATRTSRYGTGASSGGKIYRSTDGENFTKIYDANKASSRVKIGLSKTNAQKAYALLEGSGANEPIRIIKTTNAGNSWIATNDPSPTITLPNEADVDIPDNDFTRGQSFYDLVIAPDPANDEIVYTGGIDLFKSTNGAATWTQISKWSNNNMLGQLPVSWVHADQHAIVFNPKNPAHIVFGNDGGIFFAENSANIATTNGIKPRNTRYNTTQYYGATLNPSKTPNDEEFLAGAQDNGTTMFSGPPMGNNFYSDFSYYGGDGCHTEYDDEGLYNIYSYVYNYHYITAPTGNRFALIESGQNLGKFVNLLALDRNLDVFYSYRSGLTLNRVHGLKSVGQYTRSTISAGAPNSGEEVSNMQVSPYNLTSTTMFIGTNLGRIFKVTNADTTPVSTMIATPFVGNISDIRFGASEQEILVTLSNYGQNMVNVYYTNNGGTTWQNKEGNLPDMPVRAIFMNPTKPAEVIVGTEMGIWGTTDFTVANPVWAQYSDGIGNTRITKIDYRPSTKTLLAATYGRGAWTSTNSPDMSVSNASGKMNNFKVYPNPSRGSVYVKFDSTKFKNLVVNIFDASGKNVFSKKNVGSDEEMTTKLPKGFYVLKVETAGEMVYTTPIIIR